MTEIEDRIEELNKPKGPVVTPKDLRNFLDNNRELVLDGLASSLVRHNGHYHYSYSVLTNILLNRKLLDPDWSNEYGLSVGTKSEIRKIIREFKLVIQPTKYGGSVYDPNDYVDFGTLTWYEEDRNRHPSLYESESIKKLSESKEENIIIESEKAVERKHKEGKHFEHAFVIFMSFNSIAVAAFLVHVANLI